jgi:hypothetical protein
LKTVKIIAVQTGAAAGGTGRGRRFPAAPAGDGQQQRQEEDQGAQRTEMSKARLRRLVATAQTAAPHRRGGRWPAAASSSAPRRGPGTRPVIHSTVAVGRPAGGREEGVHRLGAPEADEELRPAVSISVRMCGVAVDVVAHGRRRSRRRPPDLLRVVSAANRVSNPDMIPDRPVESPTSSKSRATAPSRTGVTNYIRAERRSVAVRVDEIVTAGGEAARRAQ